MMHKKTTNSGH